MAEEEISRLAASLPGYDGPFDLLLALIRRNRYSIDALPVLEITNQFLAYVKAARDLDADLGGEFVEVASWLVLLKSRSLLPDRNLDQPSPREELGRAVLDYQTLQAATAFLRERTGKARPAGSAGAPAGVGEMVLAMADEEAPTVQAVLEAARRAVETAHAAASFESNEADNGTVEKQIRWIGKRMEGLSGNSAVSTAGWFRDQPSLGARAALLLALLELARKEFLLLYQDEDFAPLLVKPLHSIPEDLRSKGLEGRQEKEN